MANFTGGPRGTAVAGKRKKGRRRPARLKSTRRRFWARQQQVAIATTNRCVAGAREAVKR